MEQETSVRYIQRFFIALYKGAPYTVGTPVYQMVVYWGLNARYRQILELNNLRTLKFQPFADLRKQAFKIDQRNLANIPKGPSTMAPVAEETVVPKPKLARKTDPSRGKGPPKKPKPKASE